MLPQRRQPNADDLDLVINTLRRALPVVPVNEKVRSVTPNSGSTFPTSSFRVSMCECGGWTCGVGNCYENTMNGSVYSPLTNRVLDLHRLSIRVNTSKLVRFTKTSTIPIDHILLEIMLLRSNISNGSSSKDEVKNGKIAAMAWLLCYGYILENSKVRLFHVRATTTRKR